MENKVSEPNVTGEGPGNSERVVEVRGVSRRFGPVHAVEDLTFGVDRGQVVGFLGLNGAGKTTTLRILTGFLPMTRGEAAVEGRSVTDEPKAVRSRIGYLPENNPLYEDLRVREYLGFRASLKGIPRSGRKDRIDEVLEACEAHEVADRIIGACSKGFRQRVGLADALLANPPVLILDEPTVGLDPRQILHTRELIRELSKDHTVILSTHILQEVEAICSRLLIIHQGRLRYDGPLKDLQEEPGGGHRLLCEIEGDRPDAREALAGVAGIGDVEDLDAPEGTARFRLHAEAGADPRRAVFEACRDADRPLLELTPDRMTLESAFLRIITSDPEKEDAS